jgi:DNA-binding transcriptional ArsR family regulator
MKHPDHIPFPVSVDQVAAVVGLSKRSVKVHLQRLVDAGVFHRERPSRRAPMLYYPLVADTEWSPSEVSTEWSPLGEPLGLRVVTLEAPSGHPWGSPTEVPKGTTEQRPRDIAPPDVVRERMAEIRQTLRMTPNL